MENNGAIEIINHYRITKDKKDLEELILDCNKIINYCFKQLTYPNKIQFKEDLIQEGYLALYKAVNKFDITKNTKFTTYAYFWVIKYMQKYIEKNTKELLLDTYIEPNIELENNILKEEIEILLENNLNELQQEIIKLHYGFYNEIYTIREIEEKLQINNIKGKMQTALNKLRHTEYIKKLARYYYKEKIDKLNNSKYFQRGYCKTNIVSFVAAHFFVKIKNVNSEELTLIV